MRTPLAAALVAGLALASPAPARQTDEAAPAVLADARDAQADFERVRVLHSPWGWPSPRSSRDEIVGRIVLLDDPPTPWRPPPEPEEVGAARSALLAALDAAARLLPDDGWIAGQRVWYRVEAGRVDDAVRVAGECRAGRAWCAALLGFARHAAGDATGAEAAFAEALAAMPAADRERWIDPEPLLDRKSRRAWREADDRSAFARRLWWLADPLWSRPGNDRYAEHLARHVAERILRDARTPFELRWGEDLGEVLLRYGWPTAWERVRSRTGALGAGNGTSVVGHDPPGERRFVPPFEVLSEPDATLPEGWSIDDEDAPSTYAPRWAGRFLELEHQLALFRRDGGVVVVAGWGLPADSLPADAAVEAALVIAADPVQPPAMAHAGARGTRGSLMLTARSAPAVVSVEVVAPEGDLAARARYGLPIGRTLDGPALSDLLLLEGGEPLPPGLDEAARRARSTTRVAAGETVGLYWELYPAGAMPAEVAFAVRLRDERGGFWRGLRSALGLGGPRRDSVALAWTEALPQGGTAYPRAVAIRLPDLPAGSYALEVEATLADSRRLIASRPIVVPE